jgi:hypothetical protein
MSDRGLTGLDLKSLLASDGDLRALMERRGASGRAASDPQRTFLWVDSERVCVRGYLDPTVRAGPVTRPPEKKPAAAPATPSR